METALSTSPINRAQGLGGGEAPVTLALLLSHVLPPSLPLMFGATAPTKTFSILLEHGIRNMFLGLGSVVAAYKHKHMCIGCSSQLH
jgi:hypothetical protein